MEMLPEGTSWEVEYPGDVWRLERLPGLTVNPRQGRAEPTARRSRARPWRDPTGPSTLLP